MTHLFMKTTEILKRFPAKIRRWIERKVIKIFLERKIVKMVIKNKFISEVEAI